MKFYQEITLMPDAEVSPYFLWTKVFTQLHIALADIKNQHGIDNIGISFPQYQYCQTDDKTISTLGNKLRIFAHHRDDLTKLDICKWLERLNDYVHIKAIHSVDDKVTKFVIVKRYRSDNIHKTAEKFAKFKGISFKEALTHCKIHKRQNKKYPFIQLSSQTTKQDFQLTICQQMTDKEVLGEFNSYGMSKQAEAVTVPHW